MSHKEITQKQAGAWLAAATAAPLAQTASGCSWPAVLLLGGACLLICWALASYPVEDCRWLRILQGLWNCVVISQLLRWSVYCWPDRQSAYAIPLILLLLGAWSASDGRRAVRVCCVLLWPVLLLLSAVLLSGLPELEGENLGITWQMPDAHLITIMLLPALTTSMGGKAQGRVLWGLLLLGLVTSVVTAGVLSPAFSSQTQAPLYELSRSLSLFGVVQRFESLIAAGMTMGYFAAVAYLLCAGRNTGMGKRNTWWMAALSALLLLSGIEIDSRLTALGSILFWVILPAVSGWKKNFKKIKKGVDK